MSTFRMTASLITFVLFAAPAQAQSLEDRLRTHYEGKFVQVKVPLPAEMAPLMVYPQRKSMFDAPLYMLKVDRIGIGLESGAIAMIKKLSVSSKELTFDLVGVGFELPLGGFPPDLVDEKVWNMGSGRIRIVLDEALSDDPTLIKQINGWLSPLLATRPLISDDDLPPEIQRAVRGGIVMAGMNHKAVYLTLGEPTDVIRELQQGVLHEAWIYERQDMTTLMVLFRDGLVTVIKEF
jgi:hypothetical protein